MRTPGVRSGSRRYLRSQDVLFELLQQDGDFLPMGRQDLRRLEEHPGLFVLDMQVDVLPQCMECGLKRRIVVSLL